MRFEIEVRRNFLKDVDRDAVSFDKTDQNLGVPMPPIEKPYISDVRMIGLPDPEKCEIPDTNIRELIKRRRSVRAFGEKSLSLEQLSFLLWATQGVRNVSQTRVFRNVPSAGNRHPFETYLAVFNVDGLKEGLYRYLPLEHALIILHSPQDLFESVYRASREQVFACRCAVNFIWSVIPYRSEWRYDFSAHKTIALDAGHLCQNLYLACEAIGAGTCAIAAYDQDCCDEMLSLDGKDEFTIYMAPVGFPTSGSR